MTTALERSVVGRGRPEWACATCRFDLWLPVVALRVSHVGIYDDARFPGRCLLALDEHHEDLPELPEQLLQAFLADLKDLSRALRKVTGASRLNFAVLGNAVPHVHWHVVPRHPSAEPEPERSPWEDPRPRAALEPALLEGILTGLSHELDGHAAPDRTVADECASRASARG